MFTVGYTLVWKNIVNLCFNILTVLCSVFYSIIVKHFTKSWSWFNILTILCSMFYPIMVHHFTKPWLWFNIFTTSWLKILPVFRSTSIFYQATVRHFTSSPLNILPNRGSTTQHFTSSAFNILSSHSLTFYQLPVQYFKLWFETLSIILSIL